ncbi:Potassium voltage-gated channel subfamily C member 1 [Varanus komodoensis]|uniref:BTB domain-containing protein n=1 Tax=Varanus komodoensis TaxID=61221 RepID=A0A8D2KYK7_VARKO|nr:potassium voltage-gated channel subfamily C member 3-like [Varanus komodoensis]KAF7242050.1 Potassium voltage-gated channel subfamily C member 1 [Varanus komodoensis]
MEAPAEKIVLNVGGVRYETYSSTLRAFPGTRLCSLTEAQAATTSDSSPRTREFFFDRSARLFGQVLNYYRTKHLHCPAGVCRSVFEEELAFWGITGSTLAPCCWTQLRQVGVQPESGGLEDISGQGNTQGGLLQQAEWSSGCWWARWQPRIWAFFEDPYSSRWAMGFTLVSLLFNMAIIIILCVKTGSFSKPTGDGPYSGPVSCQMPPYLLHLELFFILWFTVTFFVQFTFCPGKKKFLQSPMSVIDFLSLLPVHIELFTAGSAHESRGLACWLRLFRGVYILKLLRVLRLVETPLMLCVLPYTFRSILREICILMVIFAFEILFFGALCFYAEVLHDDPLTAYRDITSAFWWALITLTTVGYGDMLPFSTFGRIIGSCTAICGVLTIIIPIPIFLIKFKAHYDAAVIEERKKRTKKRAPALPS